MIVSHNTPNRWMPYTIDTSAQLRCFCFPYAGSGASIFAQWQTHFPAEIALCPVQLPGRENRFRDSPFVHITPLVEAIIEGLKPHFDIPFVFYGHSLGALIAFEVARSLRTQNMPQPMHLLLSSHRAPQLPSSSPTLYQLSDEALVTHLQRLGGMSQTLVQNTEWLAFVLPVLRADLSVYDTYAYIDDEPLSCPISVYGGLDDQRVSLAELEAWRDQTQSHCTLQMFSGNHFFIQSAQDSLLTSLYYDIQRTCSDMGLTGRA
ncbi:MAG: thioesterase domain-containing protein [Chloroflexota bacterium]